jgi:hypothetical protein
VGEREYPILFGDELVRAILAGTKTQTRRPIKPQPDEDGLSRIVEPAVGPWQDTSERVYRCPFGDAGDMLWVRECFAPQYFDDGKPAYRADWTSTASEYVKPPRWTPSIHMPRAVARIFLDVVRVRVERVQNITEADARAEGFPFCDLLGMAGEARTLFAETWARIYPGSWERNDWVWIVEFKRAG